MTPGPVFSSDEITILQRAGLEMRDGVVCRRNGPQVSLAEIERVLMSALGRRASVETEDLDWYARDHLRRHGFTVTADGRVVNRDGKELGDQMLRLLLERAGRDR